MVDGKSVGTEGSWRPVHVAMRSVQRQAGEVPLQPSREEVGDAAQSKRKATSSRANVMRNAGLRRAMRGLAG